MASSGDNAAVQSAPAPKRRRGVRSFLPAVLFLCLAGLLFCSNPFLKLPYDIWEHLIRIASLRDEGAAFIFWPEDKPPSMHSWHWLWASCFRILGINDLFAWAKIIHASQFILALFCMFFFCETVYRHLIHPDSRPHSTDAARRGLTFTLAAVSTLLWFIGNGTYSAPFQQAWIMWYSVTYQGMTIPLFWYMLALTVRLLWDPVLSRRGFVLYVLQVAVLFPLVTVMHPTEGVCFLLSFLVLCLARSDRTLPWLKRRWYCACATVLALAALAAAMISYELVPLPALLREGVNPALLLARISALGRTYMEEGLNRFPTSFSEAAVISLAAGALLVLIAFSLKQIGAMLEKRLLVALFILSCLFFLIPMSRPLAGLACLVTHPHVVWRFFFACPWFVFLPMALGLALAVLSREGVPRRAALAAANLIMVALLLAGSRYGMTGVTFQNARSIARSFSSRVVGVQYSSADIARLRQVVEQAERRSGGNKPRLFYVRGDLAPIVRGVFRKYVFADRRSQLPRSAFFESHLDRKYALVDVRLPPDFPKDSEIFRSFPLLDRQQDPPEP